MFWGLLVAKSMDMAVNGTHTAERRLKATWGTAQYIEREIQLGTKGVERI